MNIVEATARYEKWMSSHTAIVAADLQYKHEQMAKDAFAFLRGTFYRWIQGWSELSRDSANAPTVLAVGDLHTENFGTWRDAEGRLIWGVNDFDESQDLPYTIDLIRLATSALLKEKVEHLSFSARETSKLILDGYGDGIRSGGRAFVLDEKHPVLRELALSELRNPVQFWKKMRDLPSFRKPLSHSQREALECLLPEPGLSYEVKTRRSGIGSLGRQRLIAIAEWRGGLIAREAKAALPSAVVWANGDKKGRGVRYNEIISNSVRVPDPFVRLQDKWIVRRLAPDCSRIELSSLPKRIDEAQLLYAMGFETANVHLGSREAMEKVRRDLKRRTSRWLHESAKMFAKWILSEWKEWRASM
jgi:hypothetical protein